MELSNFGEEVLEEQNENKKKRPTFLLVLCILTLVSTGLSIWSPLLQLISGPMSADRLEKIKRQNDALADQMSDMGQPMFRDLYHQIYDMTAQINDHHYAVFTLSFLSVLAGLLGAVFMLRGKRLGFHLYIAYSVYAVFGIYIFVTADAVPMMITIINIILSGAFVFMYSRNLKHLH